MALLQAPPDTHTHSQLSFCRRSPAAGHIEIWPAPFYHAGNMRGIFSHLNSEGEAVWKNRKKPLYWDTVQTGIISQVPHWHTWIHYRLCNCLANQVILGHWCVRTLLTVNVLSFLFIKHVFSLCRAMQQDDTLKNILHSFCSFTCWEIQIQALAW